MAVVKVDTFTYETDMEGLPAAPFSHPPWGLSGVVKRKPIQPRQRKVSLRDFVSLWHAAVAEWRAMSSEDKAYWTEWADFEAMAPFVFFMRSYLQHHVNGWEWYPVFWTKGNGYVLRIWRPEVYAWPLWATLAWSEQVVGGETVSGSVSLAMDAVPAPGESGDDYPCWLQITAYCDPYEDSESWYSWAPQGMFWPWTKVEIGEVVIPETAYLLYYQVWWNKFTGYMYMDEVSMLVDGVQVLPNPHFNYAYKWWVSRIGWNARWQDQIYASPDLWNLGL